MTTSRTSDNSKPDGVNDAPNIDFHDIAQPFVSVCGLVLFFLPVLYDGSPMAYNIAFATALVYSFDNLDYFIVFVGNSIRQVFTRGGKLRILAFIGILLALLALIISLIMLIGRNDIETFPLNLLGFDIADAYRFIVSVVLLALLALKPIIQWIVIMRKFMFSGMGYAKSAGDRKGRNSYTSQLYDDLDKVDEDDETSHQ